MKYLLSPKVLKIQKQMSWFLIVTMNLLGIVAIGSVIYDGEYIKLFYVPICFVLPIQLFKDHRRINSINFDESNIYYGNPDPTHQIPLYNIKSITVGRFDLSNRIYLYEPHEGKRIIYFKPSIFWLPVKHQKNLSQLRELRNQVDKAKKVADQDYEGETKIVVMATLS